MKETETMMVVGITCIVLGLLATVGAIVQAGREVKNEEKSKREKQRILAGNL